MIMQELEQLGQWFTPVINHPEVAILGIGRIAQKPIVKDGEIVAAPVYMLHLSFHQMLIYRHVLLQQVR
jgi:pyruvate dehydrogenase E2 component (dihydrolipoamide acetyltransferase)